MKKIISQILIIAIVLGTVGLVPSFAIAHDQSAIDFITSGGYWKEGTFNPNANATRAQVASVLANYLSDLNPSYTGIYSDVDASHTYADDIMLATNLGLVSGSNGNFRPDAAITRQEFAVMLVRAHEIAGVKLLESNYLTELMIDYDSISEWAKTSVVDALANGLIVSQDKKLFNPTGTVTLSELAIATHNLYIVGDDYRISYTVRDVTASDNISSKFTDIKTFGGWNTGGVSGAGMIAYFDGAPGEIYIKRDKSDLFTKNPGWAYSRNNFGEPVCYARIIGPDGNVVCYVDMDYLESGVMEKIVNIPKGPAGMYQIQFTHSIINNTTGDMDKFTVGLKNPTSWGVRGEDEIVFVDSSLPTTGYIYIPEKFDHLSIGIAATSGADTLKLYNNSTNTLLGQVTCANSSWLYSPSVMHFTSANNITPGNLLRYELPSDYRGRLSITGVTPVIYDATADALNLKSGYIYHTDKYTDSEGLQLYGPLQERARERMIEIYDEMGGSAAGLAVDITNKIPSTIPNSYDNALAEAQLFSVYSASVYNLKGVIDTQCLEPDNPWFGAIIDVAAQSGGWTGIKESDYPKKDWQTGNFVAGHDHGFTGLSLNAELNPYYNNEQLIRRAELFALYIITQLPADGMLTTKSNERAATTNSWRNGGQFFMGDYGYAISYYYTRNFFSPETRQITDEGIKLIMDKLMNVTGETPANQNLMSQLATVYTYKWTGEDRYHKNFKNQLMGFMVEPVKESGQSILGYMSESYGADGASYGKMSETLWHNAVHAYFSLPDSMKDPELVAKIYEAEELYLMWDSYFIMPSNENFRAVHSTNWTSRINAGLGVHRVTGENGIVINYFPRAKKNWLVLSVGNNWENYEQVNSGSNRPLPHSDGFTASSNGFILTNDAWAVSYIKSRVNSGIFNRYHSANDPTEYLADHSEMYYVHHQEQQFDDSEMPTLPYEQTGDYNFNLNENGIVSVKHKGLYMLCYFNPALRSMDVNTKQLVESNRMSYFSWIGGGPTSIWDDYFTTTLNGLKPGTFVNGIDTEKSSGFNTTNNSYRSSEYSAYFVANDFRHSCIIGTDSTGSLFASGRENSKFSWIENQRSFRLSGIQATGNRSKNVVWDYYLTDSGIEIRGGVDSVALSETLYMQLPIYVPTGATYTLDADNTKIIISHNNNSITYDWNSYNYDIREIVGPTGKYKYLKVRLTASEPKATVAISRSLAS